MPQKRKIFRHLLLIVFKTWALTIALSTELIISKTIKPKMIMRVLNIF